MSATEIFAVGLRRRHGPCLLLTQTLLIQVLWQVTQGSLSIQFKTQELPFLFQEQHPI